MSLTLYIQPGAKKSGIVGLHGEALKIRLAAPPVEGKANQALIQFLSSILDIPKQSVELVTGETNRNKRVVIHTLTTPDIAARLLACVDQ
ncbi:DUF167 domain-containing protein [Leeia oryzae]|uniref:DUF167 domain-containing protein n=1 Tax=Leeia oryzae TaxID=356662 RepID=UPI00039B646D|nr:DUF167 domain-containing protein [Leeia oryzae]